MLKLHKKYDSNIYTEEIYNLEEKKFVKDLNNLDKVCVNKKKIKICFPSGFKTISSDIIEYEISNDNFTERDIFNLIFSYYNGNISDNELTELKLFKPNLDCETRKDLLMYTGYIYFNGFVKEEGIYLLSLGK